MGPIETANQQYDCPRPLVAANIILAGCVPTFHWICPHASLMMYTSLAADILCFWCLVSAVAFRDHPICIDDYKWFYANQCCSEGIPRSGVMYCKALRKSLDPKMLEIYQAT